MPATTSSPAPTNVAPTAAAARAVVGGAGFSRAMLLRALGTGVLVVLGIAAAVGALLFAATGQDGGLLLPESARAHYVVGVGAALFAAMFSVWLHGRFAATTAVGGRSPKTRLQSLLAAAFAVKLAVLALGVFALRSFPLGGSSLPGEPAKFVDIATFAVSFAAAALVCQLATAGALARSLSRRGRSAT